MGTSWWMVLSLATSILTAPAGQGQRVKSEMVTSVRVPASTGRIEALVENPCGNASSVSGVSSPYDQELHTCYCSAVSGLDGRIAAYSVSCY